MTSILWRACLNLNSQTPEQWNDSFVELILLQSPSQWGGNRSSGNWKGKVFICKGQIGELLTSGGNRSLGPFFSKRYIIMFSSCRYSSWLKPEISLALDSKSLGSIVSNFESKSRGELPKILNWNTNNTVKKEIDFLKESWLLQQQLNNPKYIPFLEMHSCA